MTLRTQHTALTCLVALVWVGNGLFCKVLNLVPRHEEIVARIIGNAYSRPTTIAIGLAEVALAVCILLRIKTKTLAIIQMIVVAAMNILEFFLAKDLLLWGCLNSFFALLFIGIVYYAEFDLSRKLSLNQPI